MNDLSGPEEASFRCKRIEKGGAFLSLPFSGVSKDAIRTKAFETYIRKHCDSWLEFAILNNLDVRLEDIILVTGCDLIASWAMAVYTNPLDPDITLRVQRSEAGSALSSVVQDTSTSPQRTKPGAPDQPLSLLHRLSGVEYPAITLCLPQRISREAYFPLFQDVEGRSGASSRQS